MRKRHKKAKTQFIGDKTAEPIKVWAVIYKKHAAGGICKAYATGATSIEAENKVRKVFSRTGYMEVKRTVPVVVRDGRLREACP